MFFSNEFAENSFLSNETVLRLNPPIEKTDHEFRTLTVWNDCALQCFDNERNINGYEWMSDCNDFRKVKYTFSE